MRILIPFLVLSAAPIAAHAEDVQPALQSGVHYDLPGASGWLRYWGDHAGVRVCAFSMDTGSASPSQDLRLYALRNGRYEPILSLPMLIHKGYHCSVQGDTLRVHVVTRYNEIPEAGHAPVLVVNLDQLLAATGPQK